MIRPGAFAIIDVGRAWPASRPALTAEMSLRCHCRELVEVSTGRAPVTCACGCRYTLRPAETRFAAVLSIESHDGARFDSIVGNRGELVPGAPVGLAPQVIGIRRDFPI